MRTITLIAFSVLITLIFCFPQDATTTTGSIRGEVFTKDEGRLPSVLPGAHVVLHGPATKEAQSDGGGAYTFDSIPPGKYSIEASAPDLQATTEVEVRPGIAAVVPIELSVAAVTSAVTVTASEPPPIEESVQRNTISQSTVEKAPNQTERFESLLPLVPGVVRRPDGRINMKGAQSAQGGWLVNSANVTDPATGDNAINLPIDVVSNVQVISNPYDPEYGKFTGAISSVETRTGNLDKVHVSVQNLIPRARDRVATS